MNFLVGFIGRKLNSLKSGDVVQVVVSVANGINDEEAGLPEHKREGLNSLKTLKSLLNSRRQLLYSKEMFNTIE